MPSHCKSFNKDATISSPPLGFLAGFLLAILPKCPFCIMAYSGTVLLCSQGSSIQSSYHHYSSLTAGITALFCALVLIGILLNFRGRRSLFSLGFSLVGMAFIFTSVLLTNNPYIYYSGVFIVFISVWMNGSLAWFLKKLRGQNLSFIHLKNDKRKYDT